MSSHYPGISWLFAIAQPLLDLTHMTMGNVLRLALRALLLLCPLPALAQVLLDVHYDADSDAIVAVIAYQGTNPNHRFRVEWDACQQAAGGEHATVGRLIDLDGDDVAKQDYRVRRRLDLAGLASCRPAQVTLRLGPVSNRTVWVPAAGR